MEKSKSELNNDCQMIALAQAGNLMRDARMPESIRHTCALANDLAALAAYEFDRDVNLAVRVLLHRIGGIANLESYVACLLACGVNLGGTYWK